MTCRCICHASPTAIVLRHGPSCCPDARLSESEKKKAQK